jgi:hemerythrin
MRIGVPDFDEERKVMVGIIEQLDVDPSHSLFNEVFLTRFHVLETAVMALYIHEELLMKEWNIPADERVTHTADHSRILLMLNDVYFDSMNHKIGNAPEVYQRFRSILEEHILNVAYNLKKYVSTPRYIAPPMAASLHC